MLYEFEDVSTGAIATLDYPMGRAPRLGRVVRRGERRLRRVLSVGQRAVAKSCDGLCLSFDAEQRRQAILAGASKNKHGEIVMSSPRQRDEIAARTGLVFDPD